MSVTSEYSEREYCECCLDTPKAPIRSAVNVIMRLGAEPAAGLYPVDDLPKHLTSKPSVGWPVVLRLRAADAHALVCGEQSPVEGGAR